VKERPESFEEKTAKRASIAAAPLAAWVLANLQYGQILEQVAPLEREQRQLAEYASFISTVIKHIIWYLNIKNVLCEISFIFLVLLFVIYLYLMRTLLYMQLNLLLLILPV